jgi:hypothetical protein
MTRKPQEPVFNPPIRLRQRLRATGTWRVWWEPRPEDRILGFDAVDLDASRPDWCRREANRLNAEVTRAAKAGSRSGAPGRGRKIEDLIRLYKSGTAWSRLAIKTHDSYGKLLTIIQDKWGQSSVAEFDKPVMHTWNETLVTARGGTMAVRLIRMMSILFSQAELNGWRPENSNPCFRLKLQTPAPRSRQADWAEFDALVATAEHLGFHAAALAIRLAWFQGPRQTDVLQARRGAFALRAIEQGAAPEWVWTFVRSKRGNLGVMPIHAELVPHLRRALLDAGTADRPRGPDDPLILDDAVGRMYDEHLFAKRFATIRATAAKQLPAIASLQFRDLRRSFGVQARRGGASDNDVGDVLGNSVARNALLQETYVPPSFYTAARAVHAVTRPASTKGSTS